MRSTEGATMLQGGARHCSPYNLLQAVHWCSLHLPSKSTLCKLTFVALQPSPNNPLYLPNSCSKSKFEAIKQGKTPQTAISSWFSHSLSPTAPGASSASTFGLRSLGAFGWPRRVRSVVQSVDRKDAHFQLLHFPSLVTWSLTFLLPWLLFAPWLCWDLRDLLIKENEDSSVQIK